MWTKSDDQWVTEISNFGPHPLTVPCPCCSLPVSFGFNPGKLAPVRDSENDITMWSGSCSCGALLIVFND